jgi:hypothetical protein
MDLFEVSPLSAALPQTFEPNLPAERSSRDPFIFHKIPFDEPGIREVARKQWEALKPLIQRIYIDENKPFPYLAKILREEYGFEPT